ncbi:MAG: radical SAM protein [Candidatus Omnitrophica bacterium]|nr:radical SAM protein [Candidatus Omnitrophota bacterium]
MQKNKKSLVDVLFNISYCKKIPLYTLIELTYRCNFLCKHCYIPESYRKKILELTSEKIISLIEEIYSLGGIYLIFSGGEPLLRKDIFELIKFAKKLNFFVVLFTNGSLLDESVIEKLKICGIDKVEISLYGNKKYHQEFVGKNGIYEKIIEAIKLLKKKDINVCIKSVITNQNFKQREFLESLARSIGIEYKFDFVIAPKNNGDSSAIALMLNDKEIYSLLKEYNYEKEKTNLLSKVICSAGINIVAINPYGDVFPCIQLPYRLGNIKEKRFKDIWENDSFREKFIQIKNYKECRKCDLLFWCNRCPGLSFVENKNLYSCSSITKKVASISKKIYVFS